MTRGDTDIWHFVCDDHDGSWTWRRVSPGGDEVAHSSYSFQSFNVCVADAEHAGFVNNTTGVRRVRTSELESQPAGTGVDAHGGGVGMFERRRRPRFPAPDETSPR